MKKNYFTENWNKSFMTFIFLFCVLVAPKAMAQTLPIKNIGWTGVTDNNWATPTNWNYPATTSVGTFLANVADITLTAANPDIAVGDKVVGFGIALGTTVTAIDPTQKIITLSSNTTSSTGTATVAGTPGINIQFTFAIPKVASGPPSVVDIALISNGGNPTLSAGSYFLGGLTITNETGAITGSTLTIPADVEIFVESSTNETILIKGGNIVNNGYLEVKNSLGNGTNSTTFGSNNLTAAYGITLGLPSVVPSVSTEYTYSGTGTLKIDTSLGNQFSGGILSNGVHANAANVTYKILFNGTTSLLLSTVKTATNTANTHFLRAVGAGALQACKVILGGAGFDIGDSFSGGVNGLFATSGGGIDISIAQGTTINVYSNATSGCNIISMYSFGATSIPSFVTNKGTLNIKGTFARSPLSLSAQNNAIVNVVNDGVFDMDMVMSAAGGGAITTTNNQGATLPADVNIINTGTWNIKNPLNGVSWGAPIVATTFGGAPHLNITNSGTLNLNGGNYSFGARVWDPNLNPPPVTVPPTAPQTGASRITNSGTINTNQELRSFYTINTSTGNINFVGTPNPIKVATFSLPVTVESPAITFSRVAAAVGTTYTDSNSNVYTVLVAKLSTAGTSLTMSVSSDAVNPPTVAYSAGPPEVLASALTKTGAGAGDASIVFTGLTTLNNNALFAATLNSGVINTNPGIKLMTGINGFTSPTATSVLSPGGDTGNGIVTFSELPVSAADLLTLRGTLKMQATGNTTAGVDYDQMIFTGVLDQIDISAATLDLTGLYTPVAYTTIDIITTNVNAGFEGAVIGEFASVVGKPAKWTVVYPGGLGGKVQLVYDPSLGTTPFKDAQFSYYPNPTRNQLNLIAGKNISKVEFYNLLGQKVQSNKVDALQKQCDISNLQNGVYMMEVTIDNAKETFKIVKQ